MNATPFSTIRRRMISCRAEEVPHGNRTLFVPKWLPTLLLSCLFAAFCSSNLSANDEPFMASVLGQNAFLRSGPGEDYYATNRVAVGHVLEVYYIIDDQWCAVRPPTGSFTWVDARNVRLDKNQVGTVLINGVRARVGSQLGNSCGAVQVVLDRGEKVFVFERVETPNDIDTPVWYKIAPPAGEFRFIRLTELQFDRDNEAVEQPPVLQTQSPIILAAGAQDHPSRPGSSQVSSVVVPPNALPIPGASRNSESAVTNQGVRIAANTQASATGNPGIDSDDFREVLGQLKLDLADALIEQETANETMQSLGHQARMLYQSAESQNERAEAYQLIAGIERATRIRRHEAEQKRSDTNVSQANPPNGAPNAERNDRRVVQLPDITETETKPAPQRLALPRFDTSNMTTLNPPEINTTPEPNFAETMERYSAQESFFDRSGRHVTAQSSAQNNAEPYADQYADPSQDFEIYLVNGRYVDASGQTLDGQTLGAILSGADVVLMYDPQTGGYRQMSQQQLQSGGFPGTGRHPNATQKSWLQRLISGELFQSNSSPSQQHASQQFGQVPTGSGFATHQSAYGNHGYAPSQQASQQPTKTGLFATSQPSLIVQQQSRNAAMPGMSPNGMFPNNAPRGWQEQMGLHGQGTAMLSGGMIPQEITLPDGVHVPGEVVIYDESQGINLLGNAQNASQQDQLAVLLQQMNTQANLSPANLPVTEAESNMRAVQLRSAQQETQPHRSASHQVTGRLENGVGRVSSDVFDAIGRLGRVKNAGDEMPQYALVDPSGKTICLVTPTPGVELGTYINQTIGITGIRGNYVHEGETFRHYSAKAVYPIEGKRE